MSDHRKILIFENQYTLTNYLIKKWISLAEEAIKSRQQFTVALSGGNSPIEFYCKLSGLKMFNLWKDTHIFLTDERFVSSGHPDSNFYMIQKNILDYVNVGNSNIYPMVKHLENPELSAHNYEEEIIQFFEITQKGEFPRFDLMFLGLGEDGHTASLFPEGDSFKEMERLVVSENIKKLQHPRISLTLPVINNARNIIFFVVGASKAKIVKEIISRKKQFPASQVDPLNGELVFVLDRAAAQELSYQGSYTHEGDAIRVNLT